MNLTDLNLLEGFQWYAAFLAVVAGATFTALRPFARWVERVYEKRCDHQRELDKARIDAERARITEIHALTKAVEKLSGVVEGLLASVEGMRGHLAALIFEAPRPSCRMNPAGETS
jgi:HAMP domain-containing protein